MSDREIREYINARAYRKCGVEEAVYLALCLEGKPKEECMEYLESIT